MQIDHNIPAETCFDGQESQLLINKYNNIAESYAQKEARLYWLSTLSLTATEYLKSNKFDLVIDVGCGSGAVIRKLAMEYQSVNFVGVDFSIELLKIGKQLTKTTNIEWIEIDITKTNDFIFDLLNKYACVLIIANGPLGHYHTNDTFSIKLLKILKSVKKGGFIATFHNNDMLGRSIINHKSTGKKYWTSEQAISLFNSNGYKFKVKYFSFFIFDLINSLQFFDDLFLYSDSILCKTPKWISKYITSNFELAIYIDMN